MALSVKENLKFMELLDQQLSELLASDKGEQVKYMMDYFYKIYEPATFPITWNPYIRSDKSKLY